MGKKTPSASSESVVTSSSSPPEASDSRNNSIVSETDTVTSTDTVDGGKGAKKLGLIKRMSLRRSEKKKEKEKEKEKKEEMEKEKAKEKAKEKEKVKEKDKKKDKKKDKDKANEKDKHREDGQKKTMDDIYTKISMDDFEAKQVEFKLWMLEQQNGSIDALKPSKVKSFFKKFVKEWNKKRLPQRYYWSSEETPPPSRAGSRFSFAEDVQTPDFLNFPAAPVDLSNDDLDSSEDIERSGSFSTFGKTQKPEGLNDEVTPTMPKRPLLSAVFPTIDPSHENSARVSPTVSKMMAQALVICEDHVPHSDPPTPTPETSPLTCPSLSPQSPVLLTYEQSPGIINGSLKERYAITPDNNNIKLNESSQVFDAEGSNYTCMENDVLPGEELKVTQILERAIQDDLLPSGELTPIAEEESNAHDTKHVVKMQNVVEALQPVVESRHVTVEGQPKVNESETSVETTWEVVDSKTETGQITFSGLPPPPKEWKMDPMGLTHTILPAARPVSQERTVTTAEVVTHPHKMSEETTKVIKTTTVTTVEQITSGGNTVEAERVSRVATSPTVKSPVIAVHDNQVLPSPVQQVGWTEKMAAQELKSPVLQEAPVVHVTLERETAPGPTVTSPSTVTLEQMEPGPGNQGITVIGLEKLEIKPPVITEQTSTTSAAQPSSMKFVAQELKSPTMKVEQPVVVQQTSSLSNVPPSNSVEVEKVPQPDIRMAVCPPKPELKTVTIQPRSVSIPETSHVTLAQQEMHSPVSKPEVLLPEQPFVGGTELNYTRVSPEKEVYVMRTSVHEQQDRKDVVEVSSSRQNVETSSVSYSMTSPHVETTTVEHTVVTRSTPQGLQTQETKTTNPIYREHAAVTSHIPRPTSKGAHLPLVLQESTTVTKTSPTNTMTKESIRPVRPAPPPPESKQTVTTVERRTVSTSSASPRNSGEIKHEMTTESSAERKRGPALSPIIVSASAVPMLFQDAMKPVELNTTHPSKASTSPPKVAPMRSPQSPDKPKPAPRPSSLRSPTSPGSHIPVAVKAEPVSPVKSPRQEAVPPPKAPRPQSFRSSTQLVMATSPPPTQTSPQARIASPTTPNSTSASKIPPPKAPRPAKSPVSSKAVTFPNTTAHTHQPQVVQHNVIPRAVGPTSSSVTHAAPAHTGPAANKVPETRNYSKFMYEQPSFLAARADHSRRSMSRINFTPPKPSAKTRMTTSYVETSPSVPKENVMSVSYSEPSSLRQKESGVNQSDPSYRITEQTRTITFSQPSQVIVEDVSTVQPRENVMSVSYSEPSTRRQEQNGVTTTEQTRTVSYGQPSPMTVEHTRTVYKTNYSDSPRESNEVEYDESLVRPEQTRTTFGPTFMRLSGDRRSLSRVEGVRYQQNLQQPSEPITYRREVLAEQGKPNPFQGQTHVGISSSSDRELDANAANVVNKYLTEIKESTHVISYPGGTKQPEKARPLSQGEGETVQMRQTIPSNVDHQSVNRQTTHTTYEVSHSRAPLYGTSAYRENEAAIQGRQPPPLAPRQYSSLPRNNRGVAMGAVVVEMGANHPARSQLEMSRSRSSYAGYPVGQEFHTPGEGRTYAGHPVGNDFQTPRDRRSYAGYSPGYSPSQPGVSPGQQGVSPSYVFSGHHSQKHLSLPRSRSSYAGTSAPSSLTPEEMARLQEVLRSPRS